MAYLLDSNVCILHLRGKSPAITSRLGAILSAEVLTCSVVREELRYGALRSADPEREFVRLARLLDAIRSLPFDDAAANHAAAIRADLSRRGAMIGPHDIQIAAIAVANGAVLVTHNTAEFRRVDGLAIEDWEMGQ